MLGYGSRKRKDITSAISIVSVEAFERNQTTNILQSFAGIAPGVQDTVGSGQPGSAATILIRGVASINRDISPLIVVNNSPFLGSLNVLPSYGI